MSIKGTLETFNLRELLQTLSFNQKAGTLILDTERGPQAVHLDRGCVAFVEGDPGATEALLRVVRRRKLVDPDRVDRALRILSAGAEADLGQVLVDLGALDEPTLHEAREQAVSERFLSLQLTSITRFEFADGQVLAADGSDTAPNGEPRQPLSPGLVVEALLLDLTRKMDQWAELTTVVPTMAEVYEGTGLTVDLTTACEDQEIDPTATDRVVEAVDGYRTVQQVVDASDADELTVVQVIAALLQEGGVRAVTTEDLVARGNDLLARGEAARALPLLQRAVERPETPAEARLGLADALEALGEKAEAAAQLDSYAQRAEDSKPIAIFDAMERALELREGDVASAARLCDFYLKNRPWLADRQSRAVEALRRLIHGAVSSRQPLEAAERLQRYIQNGDAPSEDLLVLADLFASGGDRSESAAALVRRADDLLHGGRAAAAREILRRALQLDPTRSDARGRLLMLDGEQRRRRQRKRMAAFFTILVLGVLGAAAAWWTYDREATRTIRRVQERAERSITAAEDEARARVATFESKLNAAREAPEPDPELAIEAESLLAAVREQLVDADASVMELAKELGQYDLAGHYEANMAMLSHFRDRLAVLRDRAEGLIESAKAEGQQALIAGEEAHAAGEFRVASRQLTLARNLAFGDAALLARAEQVLGHVQRYMEEFERARVPYEEARANGDVVETYRRAVEVLSRQLDSDLTRQIRLPVQVTTTPPGATVWIGATSTGLKTPCTFEYSPFDVDHLLLRLPGRVPLTLDVPSYRRILEDPARAAAWSPFVRAELQVGARWRVDPQTGPYSGLWSTSEVPVLLTADGTALQPIVPTDGSLGIRRAFRRHEPVRLAGVLPGGTEWRIVGQRTLLVRPPEGEPWEVQALGRLELPPVRAEGTLCLVDARGNVYGYTLSTGTQAWRVALPAPPSQPAYASSQGLLVATVGKDAFTVQPSTGKLRRIASSSTAPLLVVPVADRLAVLGGANGEARMLTAEGSLVEVGSAQPLADTLPWVAPDGVAWIEADGVHWLDAQGTPLEVTGLGSAVQHVAGAGRELYAVGRDGTVRAASLEDPARTSWLCPVEEPVAAPPLPLGDTLYVLSAGGLTALDR